MQRDRDPFDATADNFESTMTCHNGNIGFRVPEYQRNYDWDEENIKRLLEDCLNGFYYLSQSKDESYTFLGTIILVVEKSEPSFDGNSLSVVDGQQRLTTLILLCCVLIEELFSQKDDVRHLQESTADWIKREIDYICDRLFECVSGKLLKRDQTRSFPRIIRSPEDNRGFTPSEAEYRSVIAKFLNDFADSYRQDIPAFPLNLPEDGVEEYRRFFQNYKYIKDQVQLGIYKSNNTRDTEHQNGLEHNQIEHKDFQKTGLRNLFEKLDTLTDQPDRDRAISDIAGNPDSSGLIRIMLFSHYLLKSVILTRVEAKNEDSAFDIFDSLNTTGEPLTAIETFKPRVISFESTITGYSRSETEEHFKRLEANLNHIETDKRQIATKELLVTFALYLEGHKLAQNLVAQRAYLRRRFDTAKDLYFKRRIVHSLADIAEFQQTYWNRDSIQIPDDLHSSEMSDWLKLCCTFLSDMRTRLAIPIMARYWVQHRQDRDWGAFTSIVKALTAFLALRRSITGNTRGIDSDFRKMMETLCIGLNNSKVLPSLADFKQMLRAYLEIPRIGVKNKETWVSRVCEVPLADHSRPLCRFLLFAASDKAMVDPKKQGLLTREGVRPSDQLAFLDIRKWQDDKYATVEHVAPESKPGSGWDEKIYSRSHTIHTIGNIILLPQKENSSVGNAPWAKKKIFYRVLVAKTDKERNDLFEQAKKEGLDFKKQTKDLLEEQGRLDMLDPIANVDKWTESMIQKRTKNILGLAWDVIAPWLDY
ncbi:hypothetical protein C6502_17265 [Candidatus Poribacteria bacterium]|nr:MAG: hypothetical protein C6502_17265 [Candidatus Poribacteria bacterium]